ncbi:hypothetical protein BAW75_04415 [Micromonospora chalcea]|nr:hypothetical protein BAW75_04415 [Micromonospora chalcea]
MARGDQPSSATAGRRGKSMYSTSARVLTDSVHSGASTPSTASAGTPRTWVPGSHSYARRTSMRPAQSCPIGVSGAYFMSRYAWLAGERISRAPRRTASAVSGSSPFVPHHCRTRPSTCPAGASWCQPTTVLPVACTSRCARSTKAR